MTAELPGISTLFRLGLVHAHYELNNYIYRKLLMEQIEKQVVFPNKHIITLSDEVPMQVIIFLHVDFQSFDKSNDVFKWHPTLGFQVSSSGGSFEDNPRGGKVRKARRRNPSLIHLPGIWCQKTSTEPQTPTVSCLLTTNNGKARLEIDQLNSPTLPKSCVR